MNSLKITEPQDEKDLTRLLKFMEKQPQYYPKYKDWLYGKCKDRTESGRYKPIIAFSEGMVIGDAVYQYLDENNIELKNFRIDSKYRNRYLGRFLLKQVEYETNGSNIHLDVTVDNFKGVEFFIHNGFRIKGKKNLYSPSQSEYIMKKLSS